MKTTVATLRKMKEEKQRISMLTCYDYSMAKLMDQAGVDVLLVGDSLGQVIMGYENTIPVTMDDMVHHTACVARGAKDALVLADMPFLSYHTTIPEAVMNAGRLMKESRANAVKLEGGANFAPVIKAIVEASIPVCAHIGMMPQSVNAYGGFKVQGKSFDAAKQIIEDALAVEAAGASMVVLECVPAKLAAMITDMLTIPTIGIGAGAGCDGQVLVYQDMLGMFSDFKPKFVKQYAQIGQMMEEAFGAYIAEVKDGSFPQAEHTFKINDDVIDQLKTVFTDKACVRAS